MQCSVLLGTLVLLLGAQYGEAFSIIMRSKEFKTAAVEVQQQNAARIDKICQEITDGSLEDLELSQDAVPQLSECCSLRGADRAECFMSVLQNLRGHYHLGAIVEGLKDPQVEAMKKTLWKLGSRQAITGPVKSPNPIFVALFMPPKGEDTEGVDLVCRILEQSVDQDVCGSEMDWDQKDNVCSLPESRSHYLVKQRKERLGTCCQATGQDKVDCFESLRPTMADEICDFEPLTIRHKLGKPNPCCEVTGQDRVQCIDNVRYGFNGQASRFSLDDYASVNAVISFYDEHLSVPRNQSQAEQFCSWLGNHQFIPYAESEELALLRLDPEQMWGSLFRKEARCCLHTGSAVVTCLNEVRETRNDEMCSNKERTTNAFKILSWLEWLINLPTGTSPYLEVLTVGKDFPRNLCCGMTGPDRHSCLAQMWRPFNATTDTSEYSSALFDHLKIVLEAGHDMIMQTLEKYGAWDEKSVFVIYKEA